MKNFYEILQISQEADAKVIKRGYAKLIRQFPPEKEPEKYREIREAYDTLKDEKTKKDYDTMLLCGDELLKLEEDGRKALEEESYPEAIRNFNKMLELAPNNSLGRSLLAKSYLYQRKYNKAILEYNNLFAEYPENTEYICQLGVCYELQGKVGRAEKLYLKAYHQDENDKEPLDWLISLYWKQKKYHKAEQFLRGDINRDGEVDFDDFKSFYKLIETYIRMDEPSKIIDVVGEIKKIIPSSDGIKKNISWEFNRLGKLLYDAEIYTYAEILFKVGNSIYRDEQLEGLIDITLKYKLVNNLMNDDKVIGEIRGPLVNYFYGSDLDESTRNKINDNLENLVNIYDENIINMSLNSIRRLKNYYRELYDEKRDGYNSVEKLLTRNKKIVVNANNFFSDNRIPEALGSCIANVLDKNDTALKNSINDLGRLNKNQILRGINNVRSYYPDFYDATEGFLTNIREAIGG